jgi:DNA invertase Pin-like site-specific DNA recombinase
LQRDALSEAGCAKIFTEQMLVRLQTRRLCMTRSNSRRGDTLMVWKLDRLARSMKQLTETV